jgi:hypothetical protein
LLAFAEHHGCHLMAPPLDLGLLLRTAIDRICAAAQKQQPRISQLSRRSDVDARLDSFLLAFSLVTHLRSHLVIISIDEGRDVSITTHRQDLPLLIVFVGNRIPSMLRYPRWFGSAPMWETRRKAYRVCCCVIGSISFYAAHGGSLSSFGSPCAYCGLSKIRKT